jgi:hypothetical protein
VTTHRHDDHRERRDTASPRTAPVAEAPAALVLGLQRSAGNSAVVRMLARDTGGRKTKSSLDEKAQKIVDAAQDESKPIADRAVQAVKSIVSTYYSSSADLVKEVRYKQDEPGLNTEVATSKTAKGSIDVGDYFVQNTNAAGFARRVLQVDHELEHVRQHRAGMGGPKTKHQREFLAFCREALAPELEGTGKVSNSTRVALIDGALKDYAGMSAEQKKEHKAKKDELLKARPEYVKKSGKTFPDPPATD